MSSPPVTPRPSAPPTAPPSIHDERSVANQVRRQQNNGVQHPQIPFNLGGGGYSPPSENS